MTSLERAYDILEIEAKAISDMALRLDESFEKALDLLKNTKGRIVCTGMGKPGMIARKMAATLASTGSPSYYVHPAEAIHGDLGMIMEEDIVLAISNSGETEEIVRLLSLLKMIGCPLIGMTGDLKSTLAQNSDVVLDVSIEKEACSLGLAPSASSTAALAMGDALAIVLYESKGFRAEDYAKLHPGGDLGRKLLLRAQDVMRGLDCTPVVNESELVKKAMQEITSYKAGAVLLVDKDRQLKGIFTDGDLRRKILGAKHILEMTLKEVMTPDPFFVYAKASAVDVLCLMKKNKVDEVPVVEQDKKVLGLIDIQDLLDVGLI
jgi:arabinose-5-phosphate isomerase